MNEFKDYSGKKVLYIDDISANLMAGTIALQNFKVEVHTGRTMADLFEMMRSNEYDLIILDDMMPENKINGTTAMQQIKARGYTKPIIVLTANTSALDKRKYLSDGFDDYLSKPVDVMELNTILGKFFD